MADIPVCAPRSSLERNSGDGAASLLIGDTDVAAIIQDSYSVAREIVDIWRPEGEKTLLSWEDRFCIENGFVEGLKEAFLEY